MYGKTKSALLAEVKSSPCIKTLFLQSHQSQQCLFTSSSNSRTQTTLGQSVNVYIVTVAVQAVEGRGSRGRGRGRGRRGRGRGRWSSREDTPPSEPDMSGKSDSEDRLRDGTRGCWRRGVRPPVWVRQLSVAAWRLRRVHAPPAGDAAPSKRFAGSLRRADLRRWSLNSALSVLLSHQEIRTTLRHISHQSATIFLHFWVFKDNLEGHWGASSQQLDSCRTFQWHLPSSQQRRSLQIPSATSTRSGLREKGMFSELGLDLPLALG